jgi:peptide/nickel transport system permease protein
MLSAKLAVRWRNTMRFIRMFFSNKIGTLGFMMLVFFVLVAFIGPAVYPYDITDVAVGDIMAPPT